MLFIEKFSIHFNEFSLSIPNISFPETGLILLSGDNGSGKSSLLRSIAGLNNTYNGNIKINNDTIHSLTRKQIVQQIAFLPQGSPNLPGISGKDFIEQGLYISPLNQTEEFINHLHIENLLNKKCNSLSGGEKQLLRFVRNITVPRSIILLDEPESFLSKSNRTLISQLIIKLSLKSLVITASHHDELYPENHKLILQEDGDYQFTGILSQKNPL